MKGSVGINILISILVIVIVIAAVLLGVKFANDSFNEGNIVAVENETNTEEPQVVEVKEPKIFKGTDRPIAVMLDNHIDAMPQAGLNSAYLVYEIIVEGGETRLMALFKGVNLEKIGPIRSSRHYYLDYALENDAIYVHFGWSPKAQSDITKFNVNNINGITEANGKTSFWRATDSEHSYLHSVATATENILRIAERKGYETTSTKKSVLNYVGNEFELKSDIDATKVTIPYSNYNGKPYNWVTYEYDNITKRYIRYSRDVKQLDWATGETVTTKNIIIVKCRNWQLNDGENKDRQDLANVGILNGYYITNGKAIEITAEKDSRTSQTVYKDLQGNEIEVNDGNTFIQICPIDSEIVIEPGAPVPVEEDTNTVDENTVDANTINE